MATLTHVPVSGPTSSQYVPADMLDALFTVRRVARQRFQLPKGISVLCLGGMSYLSAGKRVFPLSRRWATHYFSGA